MKRFKTLLFLFTLVLIFTLVACGGEDESQPCQHDWKDGDVIKAATCDSDGIMKNVCAYCSETKEVTITKLQHEVSQEYDSNEEGHFLYCTLCLEKYEIIAHTMEDVEVLKEPTYNEKGTMKTQCSVCKYEGTKDIDVTPHVESTQYGYDSEYHYFKCSAHETCDATFNKVKHELTEVSRVDSTCEISGSVSYECSECGYEKEESLSTLNHELKEEIINGGDTHYQECNVCGNAVNTVSHEYNIWEVIKAPTLYEKGERVGNCVCGARSATSEVVASYASFKDNFSTELSDNPWKYGTIEYHWADETFTFTPVVSMNEGNDGFAAEGVEIKAGWINAASMMAIAYTATSEIEIKAVLNFVGGTEETRLSLRIGITNSEGVSYSNPTFHGMSSNVLSLNKDYKLNAGDTIYFIFGNENWTEGAYPNGSLDITLTPGSKFADYTEDFSLEEADGAWKYGSIEYNWADETFTFTSLTQKNEGNDGWTNNGGIEIKADWINADAMMAIAYTVSEDINLEAVVNFVGGTEGTKLSLRIAVANSEGTLYSNPAFNGSDNNKLNVNSSYELKAGDTIYFIFGNEASGVEGAYPNGMLNITLYQK